MPPECRLQLARTHVREHCRSLPVGRNRAALIARQGDYREGTPNNKTATIQRASDGGRWSPGGGARGDPLLTIGKAG